MEYIRQKRPTLNPACGVEAQRTKPQTRSAKPQTLLALRSLKGEGGNLSMRDFSHFFLLFLTIVLCSSGMGGGTGSPEI